MEVMSAHKFKVMPVDPFNQTEVQTMLKVCLYLKEVQPGNQKGFVKRLPFGYRDQAIILVLVDSVCGPWNFTHSKWVMWT